MFKKAKVADQTATGQAGIKKRSKVPGVMITQWTEDLPHGRSIPDFIRKPIALTIQEGKLALFKAVVSGNPKPDLTWKRAKGDMSDKDKFQQRYDESTGEYTLVIPKVSSEDADTYKCYAHNEYGKAVCTAILNVIEGESLLTSTDYLILSCFCRAGREKPDQQKKEGEVDEKFWDILMSSEKKDYERVCAEFGVTDFRWMLKKLNEIKRQREEEQNLYVKAISNLKHIEVKGDGFASFSLDLEIKDPSSRILLYKDGVMIPYSEDMEMKHNLKRVGKTLVFSIRDLMPEDAGLYQVDVEEVNMFSTEFKIPSVDFIAKIQEVKAMEREDAIFECVLSHPLPKVTWLGRSKVLEDGEKYTISVSKDKLIHRLLVKDCMQLDKGIYSAIAGIKTCSAWLIVEADSDSQGRKAARKTTQAGGGGVDLEKLSREQQERLQREKEEKQMQRRTEELLAHEDKKRRMEMEEQERRAQEQQERLEAERRRALEAQVAAAGGGSDGNASGKSCGLGHGSGDGSRDGDDRGSGKDSGDGSGQVTGNGSADGPSAGLADGSDTGLGAGSAGWSGDGSGGNRSGKGFGKGPSDGSGEDGSSDGSGKDGFVKKDGSDSNADGSKLEGKGSDGSGHNGGGDGQGKGDGSGHNGGGDGQGKGDGSGKDANGNLNKDSLKNDGTDPNAWQNKDEGKDQESKRAKRNTGDLVPDDAVEGSVGEAGTVEGTQVQERGSADLGLTGGQSQKDGVESQGDSASTQPDSIQSSTANNEPSRRHARQGPLLPETVTDPGVQFVVGLSDVTAFLGQPAELMCKVSSEQCEGTWYKDGKKVSDEDGVIVSKDGACHKLVIDNCKEEHSGRYRFEAEGRKSEATITIQDPPRLDSDDLGKFSKPVTIKVGQNAVFKLPFEGRDPMKIQWFREGEELLEEPGVKIEISSSHSRLLLSKCQRKESGEIKIRLKNEFDTVEALSRLIVLDKPGPPQGPVEIVESSASCIQIKWRPPKDDGGMPIKNYILERQQIGRNTWTKIGEIPGVPTYKDTNVDHGRKYCYRIQALTKQGISEVMETDDIMAGTLAFPGQPAAPKVASAFNDCINLTWAAPVDTRGSRIVGYNLEKRKKGSNLWSLVNPAGEPIQAKTCAVKDVVAGMEYEFRVTAINASGPSEPSPPSEFVIARDPKKPPGKVLDLKLTETTYNSVSLTWSKPKDEPGIQDEAKGYFVEVRPAESLEWLRCNPTPVLLTSYTVKGLKTMGMYWVRVIATNEGGEGTATDLDNYILAMPPPVRPKFTTRNMQSFMVVRAGNTVRINLSFEASPWPEVEWLKDGAHVTKRVTVSNSDGGSQLLIPSSERSDTGIYTIVVKNMVGHEAFTIEVRVTDEPKPPGPIELEENVLGTVTVVWEPSPDEKRDDRLHYTVSQHDSTQRTWHIVADRLFNHKFTACNIMHGREYHFRVYAKNDMGMSAPSESPTWGTTKQRDKFVISMPNYKTCDFQCAPAFTAPLKVRVAPKGYECYMSCAVKGNPLPRITWYHNNVSLNTNTNYLISNTCGVCSILILRVGPKDVGEYMVTAENALGRAESTTKLTVRDNLMGMQMRMVKLQSFQEELRKSTEKHGIEGIEQRLHSLEESYALAQKQVGMALATAEQLKTSDLPTQVLSLHTEMKARLAEMQQATVSADQLAQLEVVLSGQSKEFEAVKEQVQGLAGVSAELSQNVENLSGSLSASEAKMDDRAASIGALGAQVEDQAAKLQGLNDLLAAHQVQLETSTQDIAGVKALLEAEGLQRLQQANVEDQLDSMRASLQEQGKAAQSLHSELRAQLDAIQSQVAQLESAGSTDAAPVEEAAVEEAAVEEAAVEEAAVEEAAVEEAAVEEAAVEEAAVEEAAVEEAAVEEAAPAAVETAEDNAPVEAEEATEDQAAAQGEEELAEQEAVEEAPAQEESGVEQDVEEEGPAPAAATKEEEEVEVEEEEVQETSEELEASEPEVVEEELPEDSPTEE
ncbi:hypothetical protein ACEWY4_001084 [Coilia grayii]|uniref:Immunoglobulin-like and fibronectin type III domain-containing protein 1 n=1 Tax=Coilia grayii TaxID=363190 RepID=A0ABD1KYG6_9TELE